MLTILGTRIFPRPHPQVKVTLWIYEIFLTFMSHLMLQGLIVKLASWICKIVLTFMSYLILQDLIMDLAAQASEFMGGFAHRYLSNLISLNKTMTQINIFGQFNF